MDNDRTNSRELFSRGATPPSQQNVHQQPLSSNSSPNQIDALFQNLGMSAQVDQQYSQRQPQQHQSQQHQSQASAHATDNTSASAPVTPVIPMTDERPAPAAASAASNPDRASALLSLLAPNSRPPPMPSSSASMPTQVPTPPGSGQRSNASPGHNENQGKMLLEQLMGAQRSNYSESVRSLTLAPSPPYASSIREGEYRSYGPPSEQAVQPSPRGPDTSAPLPPPPYHQVQQSQPQPQTQHQPPPQSQSQSQSQSQPQPQPLQPPQQSSPPQPQSSSPPKPYFDYISPFDHLSNMTGPVKKKPVPQPSSVSSGGTDDSSWTVMPDPKRQSVDNLLENISRGQLPQPPIPQTVLAPVSAYDSYMGGNDYSPAEQAMSRAPLPPIPGSKSIPNRSGSPRASPPKPSTNQPRPPPRQPDSFITQGPPPSNSSQVGGIRREKESSPGPSARGGNRKAPTNQPKPYNKAPSSPSPQPQSIVLDISQDLGEIQAVQDSVKSTAIALVKQDPVFLPGTTIGATHWVAYAMTRGRVRVISRSSGDRTLLNLPQYFSNGASVTDMAVFGNRLAGVTSDGGFVVWELPETIEDDVPGRVILSIPPITSSEALRSVKWHPRESNTLAVASDNRVFVIDLANLRNMHPQPIPHSELHRIAQNYSVPSRIAAFDFDVLRRAIATISEDSTLTSWFLHERVPYATHKIRGEDVPSSLTFIEGGLIVGRKNGTVYQLLSINTKAVLSTIKFVNGNNDDPDMFGHINYDLRIQTIWIANSRRESMFAFRLTSEPQYGSEEGVRVYFEQVVEFVGPKPTIHFVILTGDSDPHGEEAHAACIAAKVPAGPLALVAFSVHSSGVDQVLIRREWYEHALATAPSRLPSQTYSQPPPPPSLQPLMPDNKPKPAPQPIPSSSQQQSPAPILPVRSRTPQSDNENDYNYDGKNKGQKPKGNQFDNGKGQEKANKVNETALENSLGMVITREIKKTEENLHTRIARLLNKELDKQHQRLDEIRANEQAQDFVRQETLLKLISTELTRNTTRVVEMAVKNEVQNSVLPSLENITKTALNEHIGRGLIDHITSALPVEMEKLIFRPDVCNHFVHVLSTNLTPIIERQVKDSVAKSFIPVYTQQASGMHQELLREVRNEVRSVKSELTAWQNEAFRSHDAAIRELEHVVKTLSDQVKFLSLNSTGSIHHAPQSSQSHSPPGPLPAVQIHNHRQQPPNVQPMNVNPPPANYPHAPYPQQQPAPHPQPPAIHNAWYPPLAAPQASHPATIPQPPSVQSSQERTPPIKADQWDEVYLGVLQTQDAGKLQDLLGRTNPELIMPMNAPSLVSQAVILTLVHRLSAVVGETQATDESFKNALWWLQRAVAVLRPEDKLITDFIPRVIPNVQQLLLSTKQRLGILPGPSTTESIRNITDIQEVLRRKVSSI